ncbi:hypothetical protein HBI93_252620 [Parastagonospora nodorum]|nr:hypothetical protein HBI97_131250 [Parastagonospora nodorum]KAH5781773.1 hypothetical protein HBI96_252200 [Parastagonospora nodorum]KAH5805034.1 hypothetical protein HBI93_252620 [Parastagonospora nodorum]KAH5836350.1 hypothetical protein HBI94_008250 [Parastagonospora nodorum]KAH5844762.1 hypothetical protein HBI92_251070 [Parastagonospora nodorum]
MLQTNVREGYKITTLEVVELIEDLTSYLLKSLRSPTLKDWLTVAKYTQLRNAQIPKTMMLAKVRQYGAKVKTEDLSNTLTLILSKTAQRRSSSVVSNRSTASITNKFGVASLTEPAILNNANVALVDAVHYSVVKQFPMFRLMTKESYRHAKASRGRTKKDKDLEDSNTGSDVLRPRRRDRAAACARLAKRKRLGKEAQLKKTRDEEELAKAKKEKEEKEAQERKTYSDIDSKDDSEDEEATTAKDLAREQKERLKALLNANRIFANAIGIGKTQAIVLAVLIGHVHFKNWTEVQNAQAEGDATEYNAVDDDDKLFAMDLANSTWCDLSDPLALRFCFFSNSPLENIGRLTKEEAMEMRINTTNAISKALAAANKLVALQSYIILEANTPAVHPKATKHRLALLAARFIIVCGFEKVDKHVFRAYNTISVTAQRTIICKGSPHVEKRAILLPGYITIWGQTVFNEFYNCKSEGTIIANKLISGIKSNFLPYFQSCLCPDFLSTVQNAKQQCRDILEKEGLNKLEASRRVIFNCFEMQAIASYSALATLKAA